MRCSSQKNRKCSRTMAGCLLNFTILQKLLKIKITVYDYRNGRFDGLRKALEALNSCIYERSLGFYPNQNDYREKTPCLGSQVKSSTLCLLTVNNRSIEVSRIACKGQDSYKWEPEIYFSSLEADLARQPKRFWSFFKFKNKTRPSLKRWARAMTISRALKHQRLNRSPSCLTLTLCRSSLPPQRSALVSTFQALTTHIKWAGDPVGNGFDIFQTASYKQGNWMRLNLSAPAEVNRWPHRTVPDHVV